MSSAKNRTWSSRRSALIIILMLAVGVSAYQYVTLGRITWLEGYANRPQAGWRKAVDAIEELGAVREAVPATFDITGKVVRVIDGNTIHVFEGGGVQTPVRLHGIDSPEKGQPYYRKAKETLAGMIAGKTVGVDMIETDRHGRTVGVIYLQGKNINLAMVQGGHAWWYRESAKYDRPLQEAERQARAQKSGLWAGSSPAPPWEWGRQ